MREFGAWAISEDLTEQILKILDFWNMRPRRWVSAKYQVAFITGKRPRKNSSWTACPARWRQHISKRRELRTQRHSAILQTSWILVYHMSDVCRRAVQRINKTEQKFAAHFTGVLSHSCCKANGIPDKQKYVQKEFARKYFLQALNRKTSRSSFILRRVPVFNTANSLREISRLNFWFRGYIGYINWNLPHKF